MADNQEQFFNNSPTKTNIIQGDPDLIYAFSEPDSKDYHPEFKHINRDIRMANTDNLDRVYLNIAAPLSRGVDDMLGHNANFAIMLRHDIDLVNNMSVGRDGFGMKTLVTRRQEQKQRFTQDSVGFFDKNKEQNIQ